MMTCQCSSAPETSHDLTQYEIALDFRGLPTYRIAF